MAQSDTARIVGTVTDTTGSVVGGASVIVINTQTNVKLQTETQQDGSYVATPLQVGTYRVEVSAQGFKKFVKPDIILNVNDAAQIDATLQLGQGSETIVVSGGAPLVDTQTSEVGGLIDSKDIINLPLNGRNFTQLATLVPGVNRGVPGSNADGSGGNAETFRQGENGSAAISANGLREQNNNFLLDGIDNNESIVNTIVFFVPVEALQEFRVITANASAEFGRGGGAIVNAITKSGTNQLHGSAFEFIRNSKLDATPFFATPANKPLFIRNQFGGTVGGPIVKDKTFFFIDYEGLRQRLPIEPGNYVTVPTAKMRMGDFSELLNPAFTGFNAAIQIYNPNTNQPFTGNMINIPLNPAGQAFLNAYPMPTLTTKAQQNYLTHRLRKQTFDDGDVRLDHHFSSKDAVFARYSIAEDKQYDPGRIPGYQAGFGAGTNRIIANSVAGAYTRIVSSTIVNEARIGWVRDKTDFIPVNFATNQTAALGIGGLTGISAAENGGIVLVGGGNGSLMEYLGDGGPYRLNERTLQFSDAATWAHRSHTFKFGATFLQRHVYSLQADLGKGFYFFNDDHVTSGTPAAGRTGYEVSDVLIGRTSFTTSALVTPTTVDSWEDGFFAQDDWRATRRLTLNLGLRYELFTPPYEVSDHIANYDPVTQTLIVPGNGVPRSTINTDKHNLGPRLGFALDLTGGGKTVLRGSYGIFYALDRGGIANQLTQNPPFNTEQFAFNFGAVTSPPAAGQVQLSDPIPAPTPVDPKAPNLPLGSKVRYIPRNTDNTMVQQYNFGMEHQLTKTLAASVAYVGTRGSNVTAVTTQGGFGGSINGLITTIANVGESRYNSLQIRFNQRPASSGALKGFGYLASYTLGKATNNSPGAFPGQGAAFRQTPADPNGLAPGRADYDVRNRFTWAMTYDLPFGEGLAAPAKQIVHGWAINSIITLQSGTPYSVYEGFGRAKQIGDPGANLGPLELFNPAAFAASTSAADQSPRNAYTGPGYHDVDFSLFRRFNFTERTGLEFRSEFFNIFNHPEFAIDGGSNLVCCGSGFGKITTSKLNSERQIQFGLRFTF
jgi:hypothetical protein